MVEIVGEKLGGGDVEGQGHVVARGETGRFDGYDQQFESLLVGSEVGCEASFVTHRGG